jgi:hypothetical protein
MPQEQSYVSLSSDPREELRIILEKLANAELISETEDYKLSICPFCHQKSLEYRKNTKEFCCLNKRRCNLNSIITILKEKILLCS